MSTIRRLMLVVTVALVGLTLLGCGPLNYVLVMGHRLFSPPPKTTPLYKFGDKSIVILVDPANQDMAERYRHPRMTHDVAQAIAAELSDRGAAGRIINPRDVASLAQQDPEFRDLSTVGIGERFGVDQVLHVVVQDYALESAAGSDTYNGGAVVALRVIDVATRQQAWPTGLKQMHTVDVRSSTGINAPSRRAAEEKLLEGLSLEVALVFSEYLVEELPRKREVR